MKCCRGSGWLLLAVAIATKNNYCDYAHLEYQIQFYFGSTTVAETR